MVTPRAKLSAMRTRGFFATAFVVVWGLAVAGCAGLTASAPGGGPPPLTLSNPSTSGITASGAVVAWTTNVPGDSQVEYGTTTSYGQSTAVNATMVTSHSVALSGLSASTAYHYRVKSKDAAGNLATGGDFTFTTTAVADTTPPVITGVSAGAITASGATVTWTTNEPADSQVEYGTTTSYGQSTAVNATMVTSHSVALSGLSASTAYHYRVKSKDAAGNLATGGDFTFTTTAVADTTPPTAPTGLTATSTSSSQISLSWTASTDNVGVAGYRVERCQGASCTTFAQIATPTGTTFNDSGLTASTTYGYRVRAADAAGNLSGYSNIASATTQGTSTAAFGLEWPGDGAIRRMLYWNNPFPIYDATYIFKVYPRKKTSGAFRYYTTFFWGNDGSFTWDGGNANTYYGAHPYPIPAPTGPGQWEISVYSDDFVTGTEVQWDRWYTQAFRAWRESPSITHHEFYYDLPDISKVIKQTIVDSSWANKNPPIPLISMGQSAWGLYSGDEEFNGIIRGIQIYSGLLSVADIQSEIAAPKSTVAGQNFLWYLNTDPRPSDVTDKKGIGTAHNPSWRGTTALEWTGQAPLAASASATTLASTGSVLEIFPSNANASCNEEFENTANSLQPGDTLILHGGIYTQSCRRYLSGLHGTATSPIIIQAAPGELPVLTRPNNTENNIEIDGSSYLIIRGLHFQAGDAGVRLMAVDHITFEDNEIFGTDNNALRANDSSTDSLVIRHNHIHHTGLFSGSTEGEGMYLGCDNNTCRMTNSLIEGNYIHDLRSTSSGGNVGIEVKVGSGNNMIRDNVVHDTSIAEPSPCLSIYGGGSAPNVLEGNVAWNCGEGIYVVSDAIVRNNIIFNSASGISSYPHSQVAQIRNLTIENNTLYNNRDCFFLRLSGASNLVIANNAAYCGSGNAVNAIGLGAASIRKNYIEGSVSGGSVDGAAFVNGGTAAAAFTSPSGWNFWPSANSPLRSSADARFTPSLDFNGTARTSPLDVGAYETQGLATNPGWRIAADFKPLTTP